MYLSQKMSQVFWQSFRQIVKSQQVGHDKHRDLGGLQPAWISVIVSLGTMTGKCGGSARRTCVSWTQSLWTWTSRVWFSLDCFPIKGSWAPGCSGWAVQESRALWLQFMHGTCDGGQGTVLIQYLCCCRRSISHWGQKWPPVQWGKWKPGPGNKNAKIEELGCNVLTNPNGWGLASCYALVWMLICGA